MLKWVVAVLAVLICIRGARAAPLSLKEDPAARRQPQAAAPVPGVEDLSAVLEPIRARNKLPAMGGAIVRGEGLEALGATGVRQAGGSTPVTADDLWHIGSCTKAMTATLLACLVEQGVLSWDTSAGEFFRARGISVDAQWDAVQLQHLLTHRAGVPADLSKGGLWGRLWKFGGSPREARMEVVRALLAEPPLSAPGERYLYANAGYSIAGSMAEEAAGAAWEDLMRTRLFTPLGITGGGFGSPGTPGTQDQPWGHSARGKPVEPGPGADNPPAIGPGGAVHLSLADWSRFVAAHLRGARGAGGLLKPETFMRLHAPAEGAGGSYACGWGVARRSWAKGDGEGRVLTHAGSNTMWFAVVWIAPERDLAVLITCNQGGAAAERGCDEAAAALIGHATSGKVPPASPAP